MTTLTSDLQEILEPVLLNRIKLVGENEQIYTGYPDLLIDELITALEAFIQSRERAARIDEIKQFQKVLRGGKMPIVASLFDNRIATLSNNEGASPKQEQGE